MEKAIARLGQKSTATKKQPKRIDFPLLKSKLTKQAESIRQLAALHTRLKGEHAEAVAQVRETQDTVIRSIESGSRIVWDHRNERERSRKKLESQRAQFAAEKEDLIKVHQEEMAARIQNAELVLTEKFMGERNFLLERELGLIKQRDQLQRLLDAAEVQQGADAMKIRALQDAQSKSWAVEKVLVREKDKSLVQWKNSWVSNDAFC